MPIVATLAELLVIGLQAIGWLYLVACFALGWNWLTLPASAAETVAGVIVVGLAYTLGVLIDRTSDSLLVNIPKMLKRWWASIRRKATKPEPTRQEPPDSYPVMRLRVLAHGGELSEYLQYMRSRLRIARSTVFNLAVTAIVLALLLLRPAPDGPDARTLGFALLVDLTAFAVFVWAWLRISKTYDERVTEAFIGLSRWSKSGVAGHRN